MKNYNILIIILTLFLCSCQLKNNNAQDTQGINTTDTIKNNIIESKNVKPQDDNWHWYYSLDSALMNRDSVYHLNLSYSHRKNFPKEILSLKNLTVLVMNNTNFDSLPYDIYKLEKLEAFHAQNSFLRVIPNTFCKLIKLQDLNIADSKVEQLPDNIGNLKNLRWLNFGLNNISELPKSFEKLENLEVLSFSWSPNLKFPESIYKFINLKELNIAPFYDNIKHYYTIKQQEEIKKKFPNCKVTF